MTANMRRHSVRNCRSGATGCSARWVIFRSCTWPGPAALPALASAKRTLSFFAGLPGFVAPAVFASFAASVAFVVVDVLVWLAGFGVLGFFGGRPNAARPRSFT